MAVRFYPSVASARIYPIAASTRVYPIPAEDNYAIIAGNSKQVVLGERFYPFSELQVTAPSGVTVSSAQYQVSGGSFTSIGSTGFTDLETAVKLKSFQSSVLATARTYGLKLTFSDSQTRTDTVGTPCAARLSADKNVKASAYIRPFADAYLTDDSALVSAVQYAISAISASAASSVAQTAFPRPVKTSGTHDSSSVTNTLIDTSKNFLTLGVRVGDLVDVATGATMAVSAIATTTNTNDTLSGSLSSGAFASGTAYNVRDGSTLYLLVGSFEHKFDTSGLYRASLYVTDSDSNTDSDACFVRVE